MENLFTDISSGLLLAIGVLVVFTNLYVLVSKFKQPKFLESSKFAENSVSNHARTSGISLEGKLTHHKHSCGATSFVSSVLKKKNDNKDDLIIDLGPVSYTHLDVYKRQYGDMSQVVKFEDGYITYNDTMLKIDAYKVDYYISKPQSVPIVIDFAKELIGVIEYVSRETNTSTAVFRDRIIKNWK